MRPADATIPGDESLFRSVHPDYCDGPAITRFDDHEEQGLSVVRSRYIRSLEECFDRAHERRKLQTALAHTKPERLPAIVHAPPGQPWELRDVDVPEEGIAHAEVRPYRPNAKSYSRPANPRDKKEIRAKICSAFVVHKDGDPISSLGDGLEPRPADVEAPPAQEEPNNPEPAVVGDELAPA